MIFNDSTKIYYFISSITLYLLFKVFYYTLSKIGLIFVLVYDLRQWVYVLFLIIIGIIGGYLLVFLRKRLPDVESMKILYSLATVLAIFLVGEWASNKWIGNFLTDLHSSHGYTVYLESQLYDHIIFIGINIVLFAYLLRRISLSLPK